MNMKRFNKKEALKIVQTRLDEGKPRKEILEELSNLYVHKSSIAKLIAMTPDSKTKEKYKLLNYTLLCLLVLSFILEVPGVILFYTKNPIQAISVGFIVLLIYIYGTFQVLKYKGYIYGFLAYLVSLGLFISLSDIIFKSGTWDAINVWDIYSTSINLAIGGLAFYLSKKMFPNYGLYGLKKDKNGDYLLE
jgi:hypothetical protein